MPPRLAKAAPRVRERVLDAPIDVIGRERAVSLLRDWASRRESRVVFVCNVHSVVTARQDPTFREALERCDLALADGMPVTWMMRWLGHARQQRVPGPDLMLQYCKQAAGDNQSVFLYGGTPQTIELLRQR
ncbi:MAG TPA: WecB/TagA/CpsF family glycosyltransferase, partial [Burkholderiaceae bacterium]|nr:WecB/TagA/CpsF family glycosyltransferase [Burkholderiaceae bacterium]